MSYGILVMAPTQVHAFYHTWYGTPDVLEQWVDYIDLPKRGGVKATSLFQKAKNAFGGK